MEEYFINNILIKDHKIVDADEIQSVSDKFHDHSRRRFTEYDEKFKQDISEPMAMSCPNTVSYFLDNLIIEAISKEEKLQLMGPLSDKVLYFWAGCVQSFK
jgi:hypothetical protein